MVGSLGGKLWVLGYWLHNRCGGSWSFVVPGVERTFISPEWQMDTWRFRGDRKDGLCWTLSLCHPNPLSGFFSLPRTLGGWTGWTYPWLTCHLASGWFTWMGRIGLGNRVRLLISSVMGQYIIIGWSEFLYLTTAPVRKPSATTTATIWFLVNFPLLKHQSWGC